VALEHALIARRENELRDLRRQKALEATNALDLAELLLAADAALYRAKERGRNRVLLAERGTEQQWLSG